MKVSAVVAMSQNRVIGKKNQLPWHLPEDLRRFRAITLGHSIVMGRKTFESIGRVLPGRNTLVVSRQVGYQIPGAQVVASLEEAVQTCREQHSSLGEEIFIVGGAEIYSLASPFLNRIYLTLIHQKIEGDAFFPEGALDHFKEVSREDHQTPIPYSFIVLEK